MPSSERDVSERSWDPLMLLFGELVIFGLVYAFLNFFFFFFFFFGEQRENTAAFEAFFAPEAQGSKAEICLFPLLLFGLTASRFDKILSVKPSPSPLVREIFAEYSSRHLRDPAREFSSGLRVDNSIYLFILPFTRRMKRDNSRGGKCRSGIL